MDLEGYKKRWSCIKPEDMVVSQGYSITMNPKEQYFGKWSRVTKCKSDLCKLFSPFSCCSAEVYMEVSSGGRIHFHGVIKIKEIMEFYLFALPELQEYGTLEIDKINNPEIWEAYCTKQCHLWHSKDPNFNSHISLKYIPKYEPPSIPAWFTKPPPRPEQAEPKDLDKV